MADSKFKVGEIIKIILTSEAGMILEELNVGTQGYIDGYCVRRSNYDVINFAEFELEKR